MKPSVGSLFSGIGGFDLGLQRAGFSIAWQVETNRYCRQVLAKHWPSIPCHYDVATLDWRAIPRVDLICGGFPCQPFSSAGQQRSSTDDRYLWPQVIRCLSILQPTWFLGENVSCLIHLGLHQMLFDLETLGYETAVLDIPACAVDSPHLRRRIWILAYAASHRYQWWNDAEAARTKTPTVEQRIAASRRRWPVEPDVGRVADGLPARVDRLKGLGNAIVPHIAEALGSLILEVSRVGEAGKR